MAKQMNTLKLTMEHFSEPSQEEKEVTKRTDDKFFNSIPTYVSKPTKEDIETVERVLKYASECNYISFTKEDALKVFSVSTNILKWNFGYL